MFSWIVFNFSHSYFANLQVIGSVKTADPSPDNQTIPVLFNFLNHFVWKIMKIKCSTIRKYQKTIRQSQCCSTSSTIFSGKWSVYYSQRSSNRKIINLLRIFKLVGNVSCVKMFNFLGQKFGVLNTFAWILHSVCLSMKKRKFSVCCLHSCIGSEFSLPRYNCCAITYQTLLSNCENSFALSWDSGIYVRESRK